MTTADFDSKLDDCVAFSGLTWPPDTAAKLREVISRLEHLRQVQEINAILTFGAIPLDAGDR
jgi:hypothetical protein